MPHLTRAPLSARFPIFGGHPLYGLAAVKSFLVLPALRSTLSVGPLSSTTASNQLVLSCCGTGPDSPARLPLRKVRRDAPYSVVTPETRYRHLWSPICLSDTYRMSTFWWFRRIRCIFTRKTPYSVHITIADRYAVLREEP